MEICGQIFILPEAVLKKINAICRSFSWSKEHDSLKPGYVEWDKVWHKSGRGLGVRHILLWNKAAVGKQVWDITGKAHNLWVKWVNRTNSNTGWAWRAWRCICKAKTEIMTALQGDQWMVELRAFYKTTKVYAKSNGPEQKQQWSRFV